MWPGLNKRKNFPDEAEKELRVDFDTSTSRPFAELGIRRTFPKEGQCTQFDIAEAGVADLRHQLPAVILHIGHDDQRHQAIHPTKRLGDADFRVQATLPGG